MKRCLTQYFNMSILKKILFVIIVYCLSINVLPAQNLEQVLVRIINEKSNPQDYMKNYLQPLSTAIGISMGNGLYNYGPVLRFPQFKLGIGYSAVQIPSDAFTFSDLSGNMTPTIFGSRDSDIPGFDKKQFPLWIVQGSLGLFGNLEANLRYSRLEDSMMGSVNIVGGGLRYGLTDIFIPANFPMDIAVQAAYHYLLAKEYLASGAFNMNLNGVFFLSAAPVSLTAAIAFNNSNMIVNTNQLTNIDGNGIGNVSVVGENGVRYHVGANFQLWKICITSDYSFGTYRSWYLGLFFGI